MTNIDAKPRRLRRLLAGAAVIGMAIVAAVGGGQAAYAAAPAPIHTFDDSAGLCLQPLPINGGSIYDNGIPIWQMPCNGSLEQHWKKVELPNEQTQSCWAFIFLPIGRCGFDPVFHVYYLVNQLTLSCLDITDATGQVPGRPRRDDPAQPSPMQEYHCTSNNNAQVFDVPPS